VIGGAVYWSVICHESSGRLLASFAFVCRVLGVVCFGSSLKLNFVRSFDILKLQRGQ
jgi:hypothetical protein